MSSDANKRLEDVSDKANVNSLSNQTSSLVGAATAGGRSMVYQLTSFYMRTPLKLFRPARFDYTHYIRVLLTGSDNTQSETKVRSSRYRFWNPKYTYYLENSSIGIVTKALNRYGWKVIPDRILPPLVANSLAGVVLYTTYLATLNNFPLRATDQAFQHNMFDFLRAGFLAGAAQAIVSAPIDAIYTRANIDELLSSAKKYDNLWLYSRDKIREIGLIGCFGGFGLSFIRESFGFALYFTTFEMIRGPIRQLMLDFIKNYRELKYTVQNTRLSDIFFDEDGNKIETKKPRLISPKEEMWYSRVFIFIGGVTAAFVLQSVQFPFLKLQKIHVSRLEAYDIYLKNLPSTSSTTIGNIPNTKIRIPKGSSRFHIYYNSYLDTFEHVFFFMKRSKRETIAWLYKGFTRNTLAIIPGTTAGLLLLDYMRSQLRSPEEYKRLQ
ncbi:uncharacterized protein KLLA0_E22749g [Kluyveromyces lactis]|uniref:KLLA0E22749p n=1 Tax=Kluyveromyces lactis (strain ATCC 8585 / CBS 2359 / DSM 70799 / NBRC 1267 / NRRL Y-1140 / WM37) TaxID=284590 RepID=Q6CM59_KLULA|nr:uncharacterized protein KLLA0_E22749g [Kluyveromyces lactis]CAH00067.1 KLLA0E22749p [Kluyveromyces lactis]|eukprot:XP_454980.1 uncharacterized protein KLLA0_E22749g [Kluyveromyces lactis]